MEFDTAIGTAQREIALIREYRTRLIADVKTGRLDVREVARGLPDEAGEVEALDEDAMVTDGDEGDASEAEAEEIAADD